MEIFKQKKNRNKNSKVGKKMLQKFLPLVTFIPEITLMIQSLMTQTMRIIYLYRLFKKDLMQCLGNPLFMTGQESKMFIQRERD